MAPDRPITIDPAITHAAKELARLIGPIETPLDFDTWVSKYPTVRQEQIRQSLLLSDNDRVEYFQKIEQLDEIKDPRAIQARADNFKARAGPWIAALEHRVRERLPILVKGLDEPSKARKLQELRYRANKVVELDFSRFDRSLSIDLLMATEHAIYKEILPPKISELMSHQLRSTVSSRNGATYYVDGTRMSGDMNTSIGNCLIVASLMLAIGMPLDSFVAEGDDMLAVLTEKETHGLRIALLEQAGLSPKLAIYPLDCGSFCSRYDIHTIEGPKRIRHPFREITRFNYTLKGEQDEDRDTRGAIEWAGVPMLGPMYQSLLKLPITPITDQARSQFTYLFGISHDEQQKFEDDPDFRPIFAQECATAYTTRPRHGYCEIQRTPLPSTTRDKEVPIRARSVRPSSSGLQGPNVRDVSSQGSGASSIQGSGGNHRKRRSRHGRGLRRQGHDPDVRRGSSSVPEGDVAGVERLHPPCPPRKSHEAEMVGDSP